MEGISDAQRYRQTITPIDAKKSDDQDKDTKVQGVGEDKKEQRRDDGEPKADAKPQQQFQEGAQDTGTAKPKAAGDTIPAGGDGTVYINKGGSKITDAKEVIAIAEICTAHNTTDIKADELQKELAAKGIESYVTTVDGKPALKFGNGDVFVDSSGNNALGLEDGDFGKALQQIESKYGINLDALEMKVAAVVAKRNAEGNGEEIAGLDALGQEIPGQDTLGMDGQDGTAEPASAQNLTPVFEDLDKQLQEKGYEGPKAEELYAKKELEPTLSQYGIQMPQSAQALQAAQAPQAAAPAQAQGAETDQCHAFANDLFNAALLISKMKQPAVTP